MVALVHLVTLGWITSSVLGTLYIVMPAVRQGAWSPRRGDYVAYALVIIGIVGFVSHFWIEEFGGMAWSAATVGCGVLYVMARALLFLGRPHRLGAGGLHITLAALNLFGAAAVGILLGFDKVYHFLPGYVLANVFAHAHLAALGWATLVLLGLGDLIFPPRPHADASRRHRMHARVWALEIGTVGLFVSLLVRSPWGQVCGVVIAVSLVDFATHLVRQTRHPRSPATTQPDDVAWQIVSAVVFLALAIVLGLLLLFAPTAEWSPRVAGAYGVLGLLGFLGQLVAAFESRVVATYASSSVEPEGTLGGSAAAQAAIDAGRGRAAVVYLWTTSVPLIAGGVFFTSAATVRVGAAVLFGAVLIGAARTGGILRKAR